MRPPADPAKLRNGTTRSAGTVTAAWSPQPTATAVCPTTPGYGGGDYVDPDWGGDWGGGGWGGEDDPFPIAEEEYLS